MFKLFFELIPVFLLHERGQRATILRFRLEGVAGASTFAELDGLGDFGLDFFLHLDVVEAVFHIEHSSVKVKG